MNLPVDTSSFPVGAEALDYESAAEIARLAVLRREAEVFVASLPLSPPVADMVLAFGLAPIIGLFLVRFEYGIKGGELDGETELWVVVGDLPSIWFDAEMCPTPALALQMYCAIAQDWADNVLEGQDLSESYPIRVEPTQEHAQMLKSRIGVLRKEFIPLA